ncbi:MAG TPA: DUF2953 domain-containing protein [Firmicutes bacterium]|nr:DUF2953 domain-containing protein [Bacillota bacterium]
MPSGSPALLLIFLILIIAAFCLIPIGLGFVLIYKTGAAPRLFVIFTVKHLFYRRIAATPARLAARVTLEELAEEKRIGESTLHKILALVDLLQVYLLGHSPADRKGRALGSPVLHLFVGPFVMFSRHFCRLEFSWRTVFGTGDPATTATVSGLLWALKSSLAHRLAQRYRYISPPVLAVRPEFRAAGIATEVKCIFHLSPGQIMWRKVQFAARRWQGKGAGNYGK